MTQILPSPQDCCRSCCTDSVILVNTSPAAAAGCQLQGDVAPEGAVAGSPGCWYRRSDGVNYEFWYKESGLNTTAGWTLVVKIA